MVHGLDLGGGKFGRQFLHRARLHGAFQMQMQLRLWHFPEEIGHTCNYDRLS